jgi:hypothetical protein
MNAGLENTYGTDEIISKQIYDGYKVDRNGTNTGKFRRQIRGTFLLSFPAGFSFLFPLFMI